MPRSTKGIALARITNTHTDTAVCRHSLEYNFERRKRQWVVPEVIRLNDVYEKGSETQQLHIRMELGPDLLANRASEGELREILDEGALLARIFRKRLCQIGAAIES